MRIRIVITGAKGRMGQALAACARSDPELEVAAGIDLGDSLVPVLRPGMVVVDFSSHTATPGFAEEAARAKCPMVIGTTGLDEDGHRAVARAAQSIPVVVAPNMSVGVNLLFSLARTIASRLQKGFDFEIIEKHHRMKKDAPSGTAARLLEIIAEARGLRAVQIARHGRKGIVGERTEDEIGVHAVRAGDFVGEHTVLCAGGGEVIEITHRAHSREIFARGALVAVKWIARIEKPGCYDMQDVLGLKS